MSFAHHLDRLRVLLEADARAKHAASQATKKLSTTAAFETAVGIGKALIADRYDNDHCTADPIFTVQKHTLITGIDTDITDKIGFFSHDSGGMVTGEEAAAMEAAYQETFEVIEGYSRTGYNHEWRYVASYFTKAAAEAFIAGKRHEGEMRVYVDSAYRNYEWRAVQQFLMALAASEQTPPSFPDRAAAESCSAAATASGIENHVRQWHRGVRGWFVVRAADYSAITYDDVLAKNLKPLNHAPKQDVAPC